jgi:1-acyl-sn-glycerol-3-phosphate acyltransferase
MSTQQKRHPVIKFLKLVLRLFYHRHAVQGADLVAAGQPAVFICNHALSYGPIVISLDLPFRFRPWVLANVVSPALCRDYLEADFVQKELKLRRPWSLWLAGLLAPLCIRLMKSIGAIPVYKGDIRVRETMNASVRALKDGWNLVIFPESPTKPFSPYMHDFQTGFAYLAKHYYYATGKLLRFHPVLVDAKKRTITIGQAMTQAIVPNARTDWKQLAIKLRDALNDMAARQ